MIAESTALALAVLAALAEWLHARRCRRVARLAFGPGGQPRGWTKIAPLLRVVAVALLGFGLVQLYLLAPRSARPQLVPEGGYRHLVIALDVSPSMQLKDAGAERKETRAKRASQVLLSVLERVALDQLRVSVVAFYTGAKPVVIDTFDLEVVKNVLNDLPLDVAFNPGKTSLLEGIKEAMALARPWKPGSTTLFVVTDGDSVPETGFPEVPRSISNVVIIGVGSPRAGENIDGHLSRQDASTLRQFAKRLRGVYHDANEKHLPSEQLTALAEALPTRDETGKGKREVALGAVATGAVLLALLPLALSLMGSRWQGSTRPAPIASTRTEPLRGIAKPSSVAQSELQVKSGGGS